MNDESTNLDKLRDTLQARRRRDRHGARLKQALLVLAIPATALLCTACYAAAMPEEHAMPYPDALDEQMYPSGVDRDGVADLATPETCDQAFVVWK